MGLAQGHNAVTQVMFDPATPCTLTLRCAPKISSEQNKIGQPASWHNTGKVVTACLYGRESRGAQGKKHYKLFFFNLYFILLATNHRVVAAKRQQRELVAVTIRGSVLFYSSAI